MDSRTRKTLAYITANVPKHLRSIMKNVEDRQEEEIMRQAIKDGVITGRKKVEIEKLINSGALRSSEKVEDEDKERELDAYFTAMIKKYRKNGMLKDPKEDAWYQKRMAKINSKS